VPTSKSTKTTTSKISAAARNADNGAAHLPGGKLWMPRNRQIARRKCVAQMSDNQINRFEHGGAIAKHRHPVRDADRSLI